MQKITEKLKNTPLSVKSLQAQGSAYGRNLASLSSVNSQLNKDQSLSAESKVLSVINLNGVSPEYTRGRKVNYVYVLSIKGQPLMPCKPAKARHLLKADKAVVVRKFPFVIQLKFECENQTQPLTLGIDSGYDNIGFSVVSSKKEVISGTLKLDDKTSKRLIEKRMYRRLKRNKLWYRPPRFNNRKIEKGWIPPSTERRYQTHLNLIKRLQKILPISEIIVETAKFDIQKIMNPDIESKEYQQGSLYEYQNVKSFLLSREKGSCQLCKKKFKSGQSIHVHHCIPRSEGGSNRPDNLAVLHENCHTRLHKQNLKLGKNKSYKPNTFMSIIRKRFWNDIENLKVTYGYKTKIKRNELKLEKSHVNDAFIIANGTLQDRCNEFEIEQKRRHNRSIQLNRKGFKPSIRHSIYKIQPKDYVKIKGKWMETSGISCKGKYIIVNKKSISVKLVESIFNTGSLIWRIAISPTN